MIHAALQQCVCPTTGIPYSTLIDELWKFKATASKGGRNTTELSPKEFAMRLELHDIPDNEVWKIGPEQGPVSRPWEQGRKQETIGTTPIVQTYGTADPGYCAIVPYTVGPETTCQAPCLDIKINPANGKWLILDHPGTTITAPVAMFREFNRDLLAIAIECTKGTAARHVQEFNRSGLAECQVFLALVHHARGLEQSSARITGEEKVLMDRLEAMSISSDDTSSGALRKVNAFRHDYLELLDVSSDNSSVAYLKYRFWDRATGNRDVREYFERHHITSDSPAETILDGASQCLRKMTNEAMRDAEARERQQHPSAQSAHAFLTTDGSSSPQIHPAVAQMLRDFVSKETKGLAKEVGAEELAQCGNEGCRATVSRRRHKYCAKCYRERVTHK